MELDEDYIENYNKTETIYFVTKIKERSFKDFDDYIEAKTEERKQNEKETGKNCVPVDIDELTEEIEKYKNKKSKLETMQKVWMKEIREKKKPILVIEKELAEKTSIIKNNNDKLYLLNKELREYEKKVENSILKDLKIVANCAKIKGEIKDLENETKEIKDNIDKKKIEYEQKQKVVNDECNSIEQKIDQNYKKIFVLDKKTRKIEKKIKIAELGSAMINDIIEKKKEIEEVKYTKQSMRKLSVEGLYEKPRRKISNSNKRIFGISNITIKSYHNKMI